MSVEQSNFFLSRNKDSSARITTFPNVTTLNGSEDYDIWASTTEAIWRSLKLYELVVEGRKPEPGNTQDEIEAYETLYHQAVGIYIQVVGANVIRQIIDLKDPVKV
ncbi:hypothetical protein K3495_g14978 [Podosphaera aphanis]|nr:hypothetical protein K3495_g14978 [Podosphaera aphanis]